MEVPAMAEISYNANDPNQFVSGGKVRGSRALIFIILTIIIVVIAGGAGIFFMSNQQFFKSAAWDCDVYTFNVSQTGQVTIINNSSRNEAAQKVSISINGSPVIILDVPAVSSGASAVLGQVTVPANGAFTWDAVGTSDCNNHGSYQPVPTSAPKIPTPTMPVPSPTSPPSVSPTKKPIPTAVVAQVTLSIPTSTPTSTPTPTVFVPSPTSTPTSTPTPTVFVPSPTSLPGPTDTPPPGPTVTSAPSQPNSCNGTCGSDSNCQSNYVCSGGFCRNPSCPGSDSCACAPTGVPPGTSAPTPTPVQIPRSGNSTPTWILSLGGLLMIGIGALLAF